MKDQESYVVIYEESYIFYEQIYPEALPASQKFVEKVKEQEKQLRQKKENSDV